MTYYTHVVKFKGANSKSVTRTYSYEQTEVSTGANIVAVATDHANLLSALQGVSDAVIEESWITLKVTQEQLVGAGDVFEQALLVIGTDNADPDKTGKATIPAPNIGIFLSTTGSQRDVVDVNDANLQTFMAELANYEISDGENVETDEGVNGLISGKRTLSSMKL